MTDQVLEELLASETNVLTKYSPPNLMQKALADYTEKIKRVHELAGSDLDPNTAQGELARMFLREAHENYRLSEIAAESHIDTVSGVLARGTLVHELFDDIKDLENGRRDDLGIYVVDLNNLKCVNDTHGHAAGDEYIRAAGAVLKRFAAYGFKPGRVGGDEFVIIAPDQHNPEADVAQLKLDLSTGINAYAERLDPQPAHPLGAAIGYGALAGETTTRFGERPSLGDILEISGADKAMYEDKEATKTSSYR